MVTLQIADLADHFPTHLLPSERVAEASFPALLLWMLLCWFQGDESQIIQAVNMILDFHLTPLTHIYLNDV